MSAGNNKDTVGGASHAPEVKQGWGRGLPLQPGLLPVLWVMHAYQQRQISRCLVLHS